MPVTVNLRELDGAEARAAVSERAALIDLRPADAYLSDHVRGSLALVYEQGPGLAGRARDCLPLNVPLILIDHSYGDPLNAAASLRGKGFEVIGLVPSDLLTEERKQTTEIVTGGTRPEGYILDVGDPGAARIEGADARIPTDRLWDKAEELADRGRIVVVSGRGVRAALAVGILERAGASDVAVWRAE